MTTAECSVVIWVSVSAIFASVLATAASAAATACRAAASFAVWPFTWSATEQLLELGGREVEGMSSIQLFNRELETPRYQVFLRSYRERFAQEPGFASIAAYDATQALIQALRQQRADQSVKQALLQAGPYEGLQERWNFDPYGDVQRRNYITIVKGGRFVAVN